LRDGPGELRIEALRALDVNPTIVVFTAYAQDADHLVRLGALDVVEKPDFERLTQVLEGVANTREGRPAPELDEELRGCGRAVVHAPPLWRSPSGISAAPDLVRTLRHVENGDSVLVVEPLDLGRIGIEFGALLEADCRLHVGR